MKRSRLRRRTPLKRGRPLRQRTAPGYPAFREVVFAWHHWRCDTCQQGPADGVALTVHHRRERRHGGAVMAADNCMVLCFVCHDRVHRNPNWARARGWLVRRGDPEWDQLGEDDG